MTAYCKKIVMLGLMTLSVASVAQAESGVRSYAVSEGKLGFVCEGPDVIVPAWGQFGTVEGALSLDPQELGTASGSIDVLMASIRTDDAAWDTMFRRAGFLEIDEHPRSRFVLDRVSGAERLVPRKWVPMTLQGHFMLHGVVKELSVPATVRWVPGSEGKGSSVRVRASFHVRWDEYEIAMPRGSTRSFAGDGALINVDVQYEPKAVKKAQASRSR